MIDSQVVSFLQLYLEDMKQLVSMMQALTKLEMEEFKIREKRLHMEELISNYASDKVAMIFRKLEDEGIK